MGELTKLLQNLCQTRTKRLVLLLGMFACAILVFHNFTLPSSTLPPPLAFPTMSIARYPGNDSTGKKFGKFSLLSNHKKVGSGDLDELVVESSYDGREGEGKQDDETSSTNGTVTDDHSNDDGDEDEFDVGDGDTDPDKEVMFNIGNGVVLKKVRDPVGGFITLVRVNESESNLLLEKVEETGVADGAPSLDIHGDLHSTGTSLLSSVLSPSAEPIDVSSSVSAGSSMFSNSSGADKLVNETFSGSALPTDSLELNSGVSIDGSSMPSGYNALKKKRGTVPKLSIAGMDMLLLKNRASYRTMRPRWSSARDQQLIGLKSKIDNPPLIQNDKDLHAPAFRNISMFRRSYELMERTLKVYVYREGNKPIFHQPLLKGIYASEGWFMKMMEGNKHFTVKDPRKAHLFYLPFSSRFLEFSLYVPNSHNRTNLRTFLGNYVSMIAAKYPFWNRTAGTDHFLVACHDWAPYETKKVLDRPIRALCNADLSNDFRLGKDVSLPETYVRFGRDPLKDIGGKPAEERNIFAFYAGNIHGYLRPVLLEYWENRDPDMKILGPMAPGVRSKMTYIQYMKNSKYCICPRGYEVNSPRVVEAIFYECVPVIISDNYVPPFFEVLNWEAFSIFIAEEDIPKLKEILLSIPEEKYRLLQMGVKKVQRHFIWHPKAVKYDLFHMTLHSIWYNRLYTMKPR